MQHLQSKTHLLPLTEAQQDIYFDQLHNLDCPLYNIGGYIKLPAIDAQRLFQAHRKLIMENDVFGLRIIIDDDEVYQCIVEERDTELSVIDLSDVVTPQVAAENWIADLFATILPIENCSLYNSYLLKLSEHSYYYVGLAHHLMIDGFGFANWAKKLSEAYNYQPAPPALSWQSVIEKDLKYQQSRRRESDKRYWQETMQSAPKPFLHPQYKHLFPDKKPTPSRRHCTTIPEDIHHKLHTVAKTNDVAVGQVYLGLILSYFARNYDTDNFVVGCPLHNRNNALEKNTVGVFTGISPMVLNIDKSSSLASLYHSIKNAMRRGFKHQKYPIGHTIRDFAANQELYQIGFNYLSLNSFLNFNQDACDLVYTSHNYEQTPIMFTIWEYGDSGKVELQIDHNLSYFSSQDITLMASRLEHMINQVVYSDSCTLGTDLEILPPVEFELLRSFSQGPVADYPLGVPITQLFETQAGESPDNLAMISDQGPLTYKELNQKVNQFAHYLLVMGCQPGDYIGIHLERGESLVVALLAVLKIGGSYIPLDPKYPKSRIMAIVTDSHLSWIISNSEFEVNDSTTIIAMTGDCVNNQSTANPRIEFPKNPVAYVIYTSGSTGKPKGVLISHDNLMSLVCWARQTYSDDQLRSVLASTSINFDLSAFEIFVPLSYGFTTVVVENALSLLHTSYDVSLINTVPSAIKTLTEMQVIPQTVNTVNLAGEPLPKQAVNDLLMTTSCQSVHNLYGPSEDTTYSTNALFTKKISTKPHIGKPIDNTQAFVLDKHLKPTPIGICGELYLAGRGVSQGYLNQPALTAERFLPLDYCEGLAYRTGDLVKWNHDGTLDYIGRNDSQVKIRGHRIELGDIDFHLRDIEVVKDAVTVVMADALTSYITLHDKAGTSIKQALSSKLPEYMVPSVIIELEELPLLPNGKVDKKALPLPTSTQRSSSIAKPSNDTERTLTQLWGDVLNAPPESIGVDDNFFTIGGHSLLAVELSNKIRNTFGIDFPFQKIFEFPTVGQISEFISDAPCETALQIRQRPEETTDFDLSFAQQRLWLFHQINGASAEYNMAKAFLVKGVFNVSAAEQALTQIQRRHKILNTRLTSLDGKPRQCIANSRDFALDFHDLTSLPAPIRTEAANELLDKNHRYVFQLEQEPLLRMGYIALSNETGDEEGILYCNMHHIVSDGYSIAILIKEFNHFYQATSNTQSQQLPPLDIQYSDYIYWEKDWLNGEHYQQQLKYWQKQLQDIPPVHALPLSYPRPATQTFAGDRVFTVIQPSERQSLQHLCEQQDATLFMGLYSLLSVLMGHYSNETDIVIGAPSANRQQSELQSLIGFFVNNLVLRCDLSTNPGFKQLLKQNRTVVLDAFKHQQVPFDKIVDSVIPQRSLSYNPIIQVMLVFQSNTHTELALPGIEIEELDSPSPYAKFDLSLIVHPQQNGALKLEWEFNKTLFSLDFIKKFADHYERLAQCVCQAPEQPVLALDFLSKRQKQHLLTELNPAISDDQLPTIIDLFERQVRKTPEATAVTFEHQTISYSKLNERAECLAQILYANNGNRETPTIGVCLDRSIDLIVAILAVLKTGAAYVPIDPNYPKSRQQYIVKDSQISQLLTTQSIRAQISIETVETICLDNLDISGRNISTHPVADKLRDSADDSLCYIIYTSGSTGNPKGVMISQKNVATLINWSHNTYSEEELASVLFSTSVCFDLSIYEMFVPLTCGGQIAVVSNILNRSQFPDGKPLSLINSVPSALENLLSNDALPASVKVVNCAGEPLSTSLVNKLYEAGVGKVYDLYGPSEDTTYSSYKLRESGKKPAIGRPIDNTQFFIVNGANTLVPKGAIGELLIGGSGLSLGYFNKPDLTEERFTANPFVHYAPDLLAQRVYRTGDLVRYNHEGDIEYVGRIDHQVKLRGFRIELGEIEHQLISSPVVKNAVVLVRATSNNQKQLVAFLQTERTCESLDSPLQLLSKELQEQIEGFIGNVLPPYMLPNAYIQMAELPLTPNAKIDRKKLMSIALPVASRSIIPPVTKMESLLHKLWCDLLGIAPETLSIYDSFFSVGGNSLQSASLIHRLNAQQGISISLKELFEHQCIKDLAHCIEDKEKESFADLLLRKSSGINLKTPQPLSYTQQRIWLVEQIEGASNKHNIVGSMSVRGALSSEKIKAAFVALVNAHPILKVCFGNSENGEVLQQASEIPDPGYEYVDVSVDLTNINLDAHVDAFTKTTFDLTRPSLIKMMLIKYSEDHFKIILNVHHIVIDGWSLSLLFNEFFQRYLNGNTTNDASAKQPNYFDYVVWQKAFLASSAAEKQRAFWQTHLKQLPTKLQLPFPKPKPNSSYSDCNLVIDARLKQTLQEYAQVNNSTLFNIVHCALSVVLARLTNRYDFVLGIPIANRMLSGSENILGPFVNNLPVRSQFQQNTTFSELLTQLTTSMNQVLLHQELPYELVQEALIESGEEASDSLFNVMLNYLNLPEMQTGHDDLQMSLDAPPTIANKFDVTVYVSNTATELELRINYSAQKFCSDYMQLMLNQIANCLENIVEYHEKPVISLPLLQQDTVLIPDAKLNTYKSESWIGPVSECFEQAVSQFPDNIAISYKQKTWRYHELSITINRVCHYLTDCGVKTGDSIAIMANRNDITVIALMSCLKFGARFVMLTDITPPKKLSQQLHVAQPDAILFTDGNITVSQTVTEYSVASKIPGIDVSAVIESTEAYPETFDGPVISAEQTAYIAFTSGTVGEPKGVIGNQRALSQFLPWTIKTFSLSSKDNYGMLSGLSHDPTQRDVFTALSTGAQLSIPESITDPKALGDWLINNNISTLNITASMAKFLWGSQKPKISALRLVCFCGEPLPRYVVNNLQQNNAALKIINLYGSTESCRALSYFDVSDSSEQQDLSDSVSIGKGIDDCQLILLNDNNQQCAVGEVGEIGIRSRYLTDGYVNNTEQTTKRYIINPLSKNENDKSDKIYLTGDLGLYLKDGSVHHLGRKDSQVKVRGFRIETSEIEQALETCEYVDKCAVRYKPVNGNWQFVAYLTLAKTANEYFSIANLKRHLQDYLDTNQMPSHFVVLDELPLTANQKIDEYALARHAQNTPKNIQKPATEMEKQLHELWSSVLKNDELCVQEDFFSLGGHSLLVTKLVSRINDRFNVNIDFQTLYHNSSIREVAKHIECLIELKEIKTKHSSKNKLVI
ncbi:non-ribosomal peptide synthetase [Planctobacterium marinum]|uniref:non-ribosomal peptide synthetase n=1 Tax=Planctobacterium marinum TaxID=1631968 RepID=UPI001E5C481E|nr:non-ribosomal peptide synthetase [Planctobacterium marinum]MCC2606940.1 amino acid adenylation domain-containing protein [Planctobacterium marinum]